jgi:bacillithiol system protein YtxJ
MNNHFQKIQDLKALHELLEQSTEKPLVIFKHSTTCPISARAYEQMAELADEVALIDVQTGRDISREIAMSTGVEHESPQVIIMRNGKPVWHTSHWDITRETVEKALRENP